MLPFKQEIKENYRIRTFSKDVNGYELKWHQDEEDRVVIPLHETDWQVQLDNQLPIKLKEGEEIRIPKYEWHRVIKGSGDLNVKILFV